MLELYETEEDWDYKKLVIRDLEDPELIYASEDRSAAMKDLQYFFPIEQTFAIIKPDAIEQRDEIMKLTLSGGFSIPLANEITLTRDQAAELYSNIKEMPYFSAVVDNMVR